MSIAARRVPHAAPLHVAHHRHTAPVSWWHELVGGVEWTPPFIAFLYYIFVVITYWLPGADVAMVAALFTLALRPADWRIAPALIWFGAFAAWGLVAYGSSAFKADSWEQTSSLLKVWLVAFVAFNVLRSRAQIRFFLIFAVACFTLFPMRGAFVNYFGGYSVWGRALWNFAYANSNDLAAFAIIYSSMAFALFFLCKSTLIRLGAISSGSLMIVLIFFTQSRGALLAVAVVAALAVLAKRRNIRVLLGAFGLLIGAAFLAPSKTWDRLGGLFGSSISTGFKGADEEGSAEQRWQLMKISAMIARDNPIHGIGPGVYPIVHKEYARLHSASMPSAGGNRDPHNTYLRAAAETGYVGLALFLGMVGFTLFRVRKAIKQAKDPAISDLLRFLSLGLFAYLLAGLFGSFTYLNVLYLVIVLVESAMRITVSQPAAVHARPRSRKVLQRRAIRQGT